jgi:hypothetical protein
LPKTAQESCDLLEIGKGDRLLGAKILAVVATNDAEERIPDDNSGGIFAFFVNAVRAKVQADIAARAPAGVDSRKPGNGLTGNGLRGHD